MTKRLRTLFALAVPFIVFSCSSDNTEEYYADIACDTVNVSFNTVIDPLIGRNCKGCHFAGNNTGVILERYDDIKGLADNGRLLGSIKHLPGFSPMPKGSKLDDCSLQKIEAWVNKGAPND